MVGLISAEMNRRGLDYVNFYCCSTATTAGGTTIRSTDEFSTT